MWKCQYCHLVLTCHFVCGSPWPWLMLITLPHITWLMLITLPHVTWLTSLACQHGVILAGTARSDHVLKAVWMTAVSTGGTQDQCHKATAGCQWHRVSWHRIRAARSRWVPWKTILCREWVISYIKTCVHHVIIVAVYIDEMKQNYKDLGFKRYISKNLHLSYYFTRYGIFSIVAALFTRITRSAVSEVRLSSIEIQLT